MPTGAIAAAFQIANLVAPGIITLYQTIKNSKTGSSSTTASIFVVLDEEDGQFKANIDELNSELAKLKK